MVVVVVIGIVATMILPRLTRKEPTATPESITEEINNLVYFARQEAISNHKNYRLHFKSNRGERDFVEVEEEGLDPEKPQKIIYTPVKPISFNPKYLLPENTNFEAFYIGKEEQFAENKNNAYCHIIPNGLVQEVLIHLSQEPSSSNEERSEISLKMSPFFGRFELKEGFLRAR